MGFGGNHIAYKLCLKFCLYSMSRLIQIKHSFSISISTSNRHVPRPNTAWSDPVVECMHGLCTPVGYPSPPPKPSFPNLME